MTKIAIVRNEDGTFVVQLYAPYFRHEMGIDFRGKSPAESVGHDLARYIAIGIALGFDAGVMSERADHGDTAFIDPRSAELNDRIAADTEREATRQRQVESMQQESARVLEWLAPRDLGGQPVFIPGPAFSAFTPSGIIQ